MTKNKSPRAWLAGEKIGQAIREMVNLMYQKNTAKNFYKGLVRALPLDKIKDGPPPPPRSAICKACVGSRPGKKYCRIGMKQTVKRRCRYAKANNQRGAGGGNTET